MRLLSAIPVLSLLLGALASPLNSAPNTLGVRNLDPSNVPSEVCYPVTVGGLIPGIDDQYLCACIPATGALGSALSTNDLTTIGNIINTLLQPGHATCNYPPFGVPACTVQDPCAFVCINGNTAASFCTISS